VAIPAVELTGITKRFPGVVANRDVNLRIDAGTVHAIVGENGAGKSTLMKILYGMQQPDEGTITIDGEPRTFGSPARAIAAGIGMVHQHFMLADNLTVLENVVLGSEPRRGLLLDRRRARTRILELSTQVGLDVDPDVLVEDLGVGDRQRVEILKVLYRGARTLILDEPTTVLVPQEVAELFANLRDLKAQGYTLIFISHKLDDVLAVADAITVIRRGTTVATVRPGEVTARQLAELMVGHDLPTPDRPPSAAAGAAVLELDAVTVAAGDRPDAVHAVSLAVRPGEIVGIAGVEGNGQSELVEAVLGMRPISSGRVLLDGVDLTTWSTRRRRDAGIGFIPEDRHRQGLLLTSSLWENRVLGHQTQRPFVRGILIDRAAARRDTERIVSAFDVRTPSVDVAASALSGGNQQKLIVGREMGGHPRVLIASHPTRGVDVGAQAVIWGELRRATEAGLAVLLVSADLDELLGLSDIVHVLLRGQMVATVDPLTVTAEDLGAAMTGAGAAAAT
jgi:ABC-type uncharacterized transport system ATPase subunit